MTEPGNTPPEDSIELSGTATPGETPAGWFPDGTGNQRWWDGTQWTDHTAPGHPVATTGGAAMDSKQAATLLHVGGIFFGFIPSLIVYLVKPDDPFLRHHAAEAFNFEITVFVALLVSGILMLVLIGFLLFPVVLIGSIVLHVQAAMAANRGEYHKIPFGIKALS